MSYNEKEYQADLDRNHTTDPVVADRDPIIPVPVGAQQFLDPSNFSSVAATYNSESDEESPSQTQGIETNPRFMIPIETAQPVQQVPDEISMQPGNLTIPFETHQNYLLTAAKHGHWLLVRVLLGRPQSEQSDIDAYNHFLSDSMIEQHLLGAVARALQ